MKHRHETTNPKKQYESNRSHKRSAYINRANADSKRSDESTAPRNMHHLVPIQERVNIAQETSAANVNVEVISTPEVSAPEPESRKVRCLRALKHAMDEYIKACENGDIPAAMHIEGQISLGFEKMADMLGVITIQPTISPAVSQNCDPTPEVVGPKDDRGNIIPDHELWKWI